MQFGEVGQQIMILVYGFNVASFDGSVHRLLGCPEPPDGFVKIFKV